MRSGIHAIRSSPTRREQYIEFCINATPKLKPIQLPLDVRTRWDSTYNMLWIAHKQRVAYNKMTMHVNGLADYLLSDNDWEFIDQLQQFFAPFIAFQKKMSAQKYPTINKAVTSYNTLFNHLESYSRRNSTVSFISNIIHYLFY